MGLDIASILCTITFKLVGCPEEPPPPPPIEAVPPDANAATLLAFAQQPVATGTRPRNLILFIADGLGVTAVAAARDFAEAQAAGAPPPVDDGVAADVPKSPNSDAPAEQVSASQARANARIAAARAAQAAALKAASQPFAAPGQLGFELFPVAAIGRTSDTAQQARDYAGSVSALLTGVPTLPASLGMNDQAAAGTCPPEMPPTPPEVVDPQDKSAVRDAARTARVDAAIDLQSPAPRMNEVATLLERAKQAGYAAGIVTTSRVTLAVPAAAYAHVTDRNWEIDTRMPPAVLEVGCRDIAMQLIEFNHPPQPDPKFAELVDKFSRKASKETGVEIDLGGIYARRGGLDVVLGGGRIAFLPQGTPDPVDPSRQGVRKPPGKGGVDLIEQWRQRNPGGVYVTGAGALGQNAGTVGPLLGLFAPDHMAFDVDRRERGLDQPSLADMTRTAIERLMREQAGNPNGFVLIVDAGGIARAAYLGRAETVLGEVLALSDAVSAAVEATRAANDTLLVLTATHGQTILPSADGVVLAGFGGEDVPVYARGPGAQWIHGVIESAALNEILAAAILPAPDEK